MKPDHLNDQQFAERLAAYADGELDPVAQRQVERWLADHPSALAELQDQESLSPANTAYWQAVAPPLPSEDEWRVVLSAIWGSHDRNHRGSSPRRVSPYLEMTFALGGLAAAVVAIVMVVGRFSSNDLPAPAQPKVATIVEHDEEDGVYRVANASEVELIQLPEESARLIVVGRHPMADVPLLLALAGDVQVFNYGPDDQGNFPDIDSTHGPDASMLWAPTTKP